MAILFQNVIASLEGNWEEGWCPKEHRFCLVFEENFIFILIVVDSHATSAVVQRDPVGTSFPQGQYLPEL